LKTFVSLREFVSFVLLTIKITVSPVKTQLFILVFSTACFSLKGHHQVEYKINPFRSYVGPRLTL